MIWNRNICCKVLMLFVSMVICIPCSFATDTEVNSNIIYLDNAVIKKSKDTKNNMQKSSTVPSKIKMKTSSVKSKSHKQQTYTKINHKKSNKHSTNLKHNTKKSITVNKYKNSTATRGVVYKTLKTEHDVIGTYLVHKVDAESKIEYKTPSNFAKTPKLYSYSALVMNAKTGDIIINKHPEEKLSIASITKLMTAMVVLDSGVDLDKYVTISSEDVDNLRNTFSRLNVGNHYKRRDLLLLALMSSENRAASALARTTYMGGISEFIHRMNSKATVLGMKNTRFYDATGLLKDNQSTAEDVAKMVKAAFNYNEIRDYTTTKSADVSVNKNSVHRYINSDALVRSGKMQIQLSKTGFINESGYCLVLYGIFADTPVVMVFLNSAGKSGRILDALSVENYLNSLY